MARAALYTVLAVATVGLLLYGMLYAADLAGILEFTRRVPLIFAPALLVAVFVGLAFGISRAAQALSSDPSRAPSPGAARIQKVIYVAMAVILAVIVSGAGLFFYGLATDDKVAIFIVQTADFLVTPFRRILVLDDNYLQVGVNWGIGAVAYLAAGLGLSALVDVLANRRAGRAAD